MYSPLEVILSVAEQGRRRVGMKKRKVSQLGQGSLRIWRAGAAVLVALVLGSCSSPSSTAGGSPQDTSAALPLSTPGDTSRIELVGTAIEQGYHIYYYRNLAYPCSISGYQTFVIAYRSTVGMSHPSPLWVWARGGGAGYFDTAGLPLPDDKNMREETMQSLTQKGTEPGLFALLRNHPLNFRFLSVSYCNRDLYGGANRIDPNNPNQQSNAAPITTNGLLATKAAIQFALDRVRTTQFVLHGGSAGSFGAYSLAWSLQQQGLPPAGIVADSGVTNRDWLRAVITQRVACPGLNPAASAPAAVAARMHPDLANANNEPDKLVSDGRLTVPIMHVWSHGDPMGCGLAPMACPLRDGTTMPLGGTDCMNEPLRRAIAAQGPSSRSSNLAVCVAEPTNPRSVDPCGRHVVTLIAGTNTDSRSPGEYNAEIMSWVEKRLRTMA
jgi:hypothetical protein